MLVSAGRELLGTQLPGLEHRRGGRPPCTARLHLRGAYLLLGTHVCAPGPQIPEVLGPHITAGMVPPLGAGILVFPSVSPWFLTAGPRDTAA